MTYVLDIQEFFWLWLAVTTPLVAVIYGLFRLGDWLGRVLARCS